MKLKFWVFEKKKNLTWSLQRTYTFIYIYTFMSRYVTQLMIRAAVIFADSSVTTEKSYQIFKTQNSQYSLISKDLKIGLGSFIFSLLRSKTTFSDILFHYIWKQVYLHSMEASGLMLSTCGTWNNQTDISTFYIKHDERTTCVRKLCKCSHI